MTPETSRQAVRGVICPACSHVDAVIEETHVRPLDASDVIGAWMFGWVGALAALTGRTTKRLRCGRCSCRFSRGVGLFTKLFWWMVVVGVAMVIAGVSAAMLQPTMATGALSPVSGACSWLAANPLVAVVLVATFLLVLFFSAVIAHTNAAVERRHLYNALLKREQPLAEPPSVPATSERLGKFYRR